ncbi:MAG: ADP-ribosylglycohydrolase [Candidatus Ozemobacter sibiricus]|uniref:ADP-ribosylglycohydrolase n=1 Tax=Candidatus Ozemobacter sibiricus TaxID=2268124 RepID=A0A367ZKL3_9BACT|nr:MAG: ADP-ribosylglycohydrolase [Candidatus Ozemobacter sibiricus]
MIDKFQAALLGFAIGDALAAPIEDVIRDSFEGPKVITQYVRAFPSHPVSHLEVGQWSDETQIMLVVADSLIAARGFAIEDLANRFVDWYHSQKLRSAWRFPSNTMMKACRKLAAGIPWNQAGFPSAGVIAAARTVPIALAFWRTPALLRDAIEKSCRLTHTDPRVIGAALILATAIRMGLEGGEPVPETMLNAAIEKAQGYSPEIVKRLKTLREVLRLDPPAAMEQIGNTGFCLDAVPAALYWFFRHPRRFDDLIIGAANVGGDADAVAAMAGAIFGAFNGRAAIPEKWLVPLEAVPRLEQTGVDLYRLAVPAK